MLDEIKPPDQSENSTNVCCCCKDTTIYLHFIPKMDEIVFCCSQVCSQVIEDK